MRIRAPVNKRSVTSFGQNREGHFGTYRFPDCSDVLVVRLKLSGPNSTWRMTFQGKAVMLSVQRPEDIEAWLQSQKMFHMISPDRWEHYRLWIVQQILDKLQVIQMMIQQKKQPVVRKVMV